MEELVSDNVTFLFSVQVHLTDEAYVYSKTPSDTMGEKVNKNLFFDLSLSHLYITTEKKVCMSGHISKTLYTCRLSICPKCNIMYHLNIVNS